jgi:hypothetical protein
VPEPDDVTEIPDLYKHVADSMVIVTPAVASQAAQLGPITPDQWLANKPKGRFIVPAYIRYGTRGFLAEPTDTSVPSQWRAPNSAMASAAMIDNAVEMVDVTLAPYLADGTIEFKSISEIIELYRTYEHCLDLTDGMDLSGYVVE